MFWKVFQIVSALVVVALVAAASILAEPPTNSRGAQPSMQSKPIQAQPGKNFNF